MKEFKIEKIKREAYFIREFFKVVKPVFGTKEFEDFMITFPFNIFYKCECNSCFLFSSEIEEFKNTPQYRKYKRGFTQVIRVEPLILASFNQSFRFHYIEPNLVEINMLRVIYVSKELLIFLIHFSSEDNIYDLKRKIEVPIFFEKYANLLNLSNEDKKYGLFLCINFSKKDIKVFREPDYKNHEIYKIETKIGFLYTMYKENYAKEEKNPIILKTMLEDLRFIIDGCYYYIFSKQTLNIINLLEKNTVRKLKDVKNFIKKFKRSISK
jgi:hypothetical protein